MSKIKALSLKETSIKEKLKEHYLNELKDKEKFDLLCRLEDFEIEYWNEQQEKQDLIKYLKDNIKKIDDMFMGLVPQDVVWQSEMIMKKKTYQEMLNKIEGENNE